MTRLDGLLRRTRSGAGPPTTSQELRRVLVGADPAAGTIDVAYEACEQPTDPTGHVQADSLAVMLKNTLEDLVTLLQGDQQPTALDLQVDFLVPMRPGALYGRGWLVERGPGLAHLAGELVNPLGEPVAQATATAVIPGGLTSSAHDPPAPSPATTHRARPWKLLGDVRADPAIVQAHPVAVPDGRGARQR